MFLRRLANNREFVQNEVFFYLDAHWNADLPLKAEVQFIFETFLRAVIMVDDFKVPGDHEYEFDNYGEGKALSLEYLHPLVDELELTAFFPSQSARLETGARRGCVVLARDPDLIENLKKMTTLVTH